LISTFIILIYINSIHSTISTNTISPRSRHRKTFFEGHLYLQKLYPGLSPLGNLQFSQNKLTLKYFSLNGKLLYFTHPEDEKTEIRGAIKIKFLIDKRIDQPTKGKCCSNVVFRDYNQNSKNPRKMPLFQKNKKMKEIQITV